jgi:hypothetical protein
MPTTPAKIEEVFAEHGWATDRYSGARIDTTFFFADPAKRTQLGWRHGLIEDGAVIDGPTCLRRVHLIAVAA